MVMADEDIRAHRIWIQSMGIRCIFAWFTIFAGNKKKSKTLQSNWKYLVVITEAENRLRRARGGAFPAKQENTVLYSESKAEKLQNVKYVDALTYFFFSFSITKEIWITQERKKELRVPGEPIQLCEERNEVYSFCVMSRQEKVQDELNSNIKTNYLGTDVQSVPLLLPGTDLRTSSPICSFIRTIFSPLSLFVSFS